MPIGEKVIALEKLSPMRLPSKRSSHARGRLGGWTTGGAIGRVSVRCLRCDQRIAPSFRMAFRRMLELGNA